uniref:Uncharacterized protein n=1 Tax=Haptolina brevifila TaxID=156173 RepID=A0A7S2N6N0_9EUKA
MVDAPACQHGGQTQAGQTQAGQMQASQMQGGQTQGGQTQGGQVFHGIQQHPQQRATDSAGAGSCSGGVDAPAPPGSALLPAQADSAPGSIAPIPTEEGAGRCVPVGALGRMEQAESILEGMFNNGSVSANPCANR